MYFSLLRQNYLLSYLGVTVFNISAASGFLQLIDLIVYRFPALICLTYKLPNISISTSIMLPILKYQKRRGKNLIFELLDVFLTVFLESFLSSNLIKLFLS